MILAPVWKALETSTVGSYIAGSEWAFPTIESIHVIAIITVVGMIMVMDLRLLGVASRNHAVTAMSRDTLPFTWGAFVIAAITGSLLFVSKASGYAINPWFRFKLVFLALAGINMAILHVTVWKTVHDWDTRTVIPRQAKVAATLSLVFWLLVVFCGRLIGFTLGIYEGRG